LTKYYLPAIFSLESRSLKRKENITMKAIKDFFLEVCIWVYLNSQIIFVLSCMLIGGVAGWFIPRSYSITLTIFFSIIWGICGLVFGLMIVRIVTPQTNHIFSKKEKTKKVTKK